MFLPKLISHSLICFGCLFSSVVLAQEENRILYNKWEFGGSLSQMIFDPSVETNRNIAVEDSALVVSLNADYDAGRWLTTLGMDILLYDDLAGFTQRTEDSSGRQEDSDSSATGFMLSAAVGPKWHFAKDASAMFSVQAGMSYMVDSSRSIGFCSDCATEDIDIEGGLFAKAQILKNTGTVAWGLQFTQYLSSDEIDNSIGIVLSSAY